ncbi:MAG: zf-HC2 domain-containing protein [Bacteroidetes bacterium]|nr:zf-HC2 domain-containing protein [Bacteroidota bacterium]
MAAHDQEGIFKYLSGNLSSSEKAHVEAHLSTCTECSELLAFVRDFNSSLRGMSPEELQPDTPCPSADTIASFAADELDEAAAQSVRQHTIFCRSCLEEVFLLHRATKAAGFIATSKPSARTTPLRQLLQERTQQPVVHFRPRKTHERDSLTGSVPSTPKLLRFSVHDGEYPERPALVQELLIGENAYNLAVTVSREGSLSFDIAGIRTPVKEPLHVSVSSESGKELASSQSDKSGHCRFSVRSTSGINNARILTLTLEESEQRFLLRLPGPHRSL